MGSARWIPWPMVWQNSAWSQQSFWCGEKNQLLHLFLVIPVLDVLGKHRQTFLFLFFLKWKSHMSSVIYFRHNDMQDCVIKLGTWYRTAVAEARGRLFVLFFGGSSRKQMLCNRFLHIVHSLDISFLKILAMRSWPSRKYRNCMLKVHFVVGNLRKLCGRSAEAPRKG